MNRGKSNDRGFGSISLLVALVLVGFTANIFLLMPLPYPTWCMACIAATTYRVFRIART